jgi:transmembrane sensor
VSLDEGLSADERRKLEQWLAADPSHGRVLVEMAHRWDEQNVLSGLAEFFPFDHHKGAQSRRASFALAVAAVLIATLGLGWFVAREFSFSTAGSDGVSQSHVKQNYVDQEAHLTAVGQQAVVQLADGSSINLNTDTLLDVAYSAERRVIRLHRGEASFKVAHDVQRPFEVQVGEHVIRALGTVFNVRLEALSDFELMVNEGRVEVTDIGATSDERKGRDNSTSQAASSATEVGASEIAVIREGAATVRDLEETELTTKLAWQRGMLIFRGEPLHAVIADVSRYTTKKFVIADDSILDVRVGGYFATDNVDGLLLALEKSFGVVSTLQEDDVIVLTKR